MATIKEFNEASESAIWITHNRFAEEQYKQCTRWKMQEQIRVNMSRFPDVPVKTVLEFTLADYTIKPKKR